LAGVDSVRSTQEKWRLPDEALSAWRRENFRSMSRPRKYAPESLERAVRMVAESGRPIAHVARDLGIGSEVLRNRRDAPYWWEWRACYRHLLPALLGAARVCVRAV
jgi:hypothetical protein